MKVDYWGGGLSFALDTAFLRSHFEGYDPRWVGHVKNTRIMWAGIWLRVL